MADGLYTFGTQEIVEVPSTGPQYANDATAKAPLGILYRHQGNVYRYVQFDDGSDAVAAAAGSVAYWKTLAPTSGSFIVTCDVSSAIGTGKNMCAGVLGCVVTDQYYTWAQVAGVVSAKTAASFVAGDKAIYGADGAFARIAAGGANTDVIFAVALGTRNTTTSLTSVLLHNMAW